MLLRGANNTDPFVQCYRLVSQLWFIHNETRSHGKAFPNFVNLFPERNKCTVHWRLRYVKTLNMGMKTKGNRNKSSRKKNTLVSSFISSFCYLCVCMSRETRETTQWRGWRGGIITSLYREPQEKCNAGKPIVKHDLNKKQTLWWMFYSVRIPVRVRIKSGHRETWTLWNRLTNIWTYQTWQHEPRGAVQQHAGTNTRSLGYAGVLCQLHIGQRGSIKLRS